MNKTGLRIPLIISLLIVTVLGFALKYYSGPGSKWPNDYGAGVMYVVFFILLFFLIFPSGRNIARVTVWVFVITCALETLQLWHPPFLQIIRQTFIGRALIGTSFVWWDFPHYLLGAFLGWGLVRLIYRNVTRE